MTKDKKPQKKQLFERLKNHIQHKINNNLKKLEANKLHPNKIELELGIFIEMLEPQVRQAVLELHSKGYSTDVSGFMYNACDQKIEGDFQLANEVKRKLRALGVIVITNPSGYTMLQFSPKEADIQKIKRMWNKIASILPDRKTVASASMTRKAREFRVNN